MTLSNQHSAEKAERERYENLYKNLEKNNASVGKEVQKFQTQAKEEETAVVWNYFHPLSVINPISL